MTDKRRRSVDEKERVGKAAPAMAAPQAWLAFPEVAPEALRGAPEALVERVRL